MRVYTYDDFRRTTHVPWYNVS